MKLRYLIIGLLFIIPMLITGCTSNQKYLQLTSAQDDISSQNQPYQLKFFVINPTDNTFTGQLIYSYDKSCLSTSDSEPIEVTPKEYRKAIVKQFSYNSGYSNQNSCLQKPLVITVSIEDKGGDIKDTFSTKLTITS